MWETGIARHRANDTSAPAVATLGHGAVPTCQPFNAPAATMFTPPATVRGSALLAGPLRPPGSPPEELRVDGPCVVAVVGVAAPWPVRDKPNTAPPASTTTSPRPAPTTDFVRGRR